jgi:hypothetical protein
MDGPDFDSLVRRLFSNRTRRGLLGLLAALPLAGATEAARKRRRQPIEAEACIPSGRRCPARHPRKGRRPLSCKQCCQDFVVKHGRQKRCACAPNGVACGARGASACCSGNCVSEVCQANTPPLTCSAANCGGCCTGSTCRPGDILAACGAGGVTCAQCIGDPEDVVCTDLAGNHTCSRFCADDSECSGGGTGCVCRESIGRRRCVSELDSGATCFATALACLAGCPSGRLCLQPTASTHWCLGGAWACVASCAV